LTDRHNRDDEVPEVDPEEFPGVDDLETAYLAWTIWKGLDYKVPLKAGGILDQPEKLFTDVVTINGIDNEISDMIARSKAEEQRSRELAESIARSSQM
jgi:hypothetical protein